MWANGEYDYLIRRQAVGIVMDRMASGYEGSLDCWPTLFQQLAGSDWRRIGKLYVRYRVCEDDGQSLHGLRQGYY